MDKNRQAIDALWDTNLESSDEKLMLYHLMSKHELGEKHSSHWKSLEGFLKDFRDRWCSEKEIANATRLSEAKLSRTIKSLQKKGYIKTESRTTGANPKNPPTSESTENIYAITDKLFSDYLSAPPH